MPNIFTARCSLPGRLHLSELLLAEELENTISTVLPKLFTIRLANTMKTLHIKLHYWKVVHKASQVQVFIL